MRVKMRTFLFIFLAGYAVSSDDKYYVVRMPETPQPKEFKVYWNVPTMQCKSKCIPFDDLFEKYGIIQNTNDTFLGDSVSILYDPGNFPALIKNASTGELRYRNGGVPQQGDLMDHLQNFKKEIERSIPDVNYQGLGIIDFESWRPILRQNFGSLTPYKDVSYDIERKRHWWWKKQWIEDEAKRRFDESGRDFMKTTLSLVKKMRPNALWGYYGYPQCFNRPQNMRPEQCANDIPMENNKIPWLWSESTVLYPSVYSTKDVTGDRLGAFIRGRIKESARVRVKGTPILPYWWYRYRDGEYFREEDLKTSFNTFYNSNAGGFIIWGSSKDVNTKDKCMKLKKYVNDVLGPMVAKYTRNRRKQNDEPVETDPEEFKPVNVTEYDPDYQWIPPENYTSNIEKIVDEELKDNNVNTIYVNGNLLIDMILDRIANFCLGDCERKGDVGLQSPPVLTTKNPFEETDSKTINTARIPTVNQEFLTTKISDVLVTNTITTEIISSQKASASTDIESNDQSTISIYRKLDDASYLYTNENSAETYTEDPKDIVNIQNPIECDDAITKNYNNHNISFNESSEHNLDYDINSTTNNIQETSLIINANTPRIDSNDSSFIISNTSTENISLNDISTTNMDLSNTSPANLDSTDTIPSSTASRPGLINWRDFYLDLLMPPKFAKKILDSRTEISEINTTVAPELKNKVFITFV